MTSTAPYGDGDADAKRRARPKVSLNDLRRKRKAGQPLTMLTAYDHPFARLCDETDVDMLLVGDSVGMVSLGLDSTVAVTLEEMLHHCRAVSRGARRAFLVGDMPFGSYLTVDDAVHNGARLLKEGGMDAVKLEGGARVADKIRALVDCGVNVMAHVGLTPQSSASQGGYVVQGKTSEAAAALLADALAVQEAGAFAVVLECVPHKLAQFVTERLAIPTIGIGAGPGCSGQVQVLHDVLGLFDGFSPRFSRRFGELRPAVSQALHGFVESVTRGEFPTRSQHSFAIGDKAWARFLATHSPPAAARPAAARASSLPSAPGRLQRALSTAPSSPPHTVSHTYTCTVVVVGNGALGCHVAADLARGREVRLLCRDPEAAALINARGGVIVDGELVTGVSATADPADVRGCAQLVVLAVKAGDVASAAPAAVTALADGGRLLTLQNGMGFEQDLPADAVLGVTSRGVELLAPGEVRCHGRGSTAVGEPLLEAAPGPFEVVPDIEARRWTKLAVSCAINPITALLRSENGAVTRPDLEPLLRRVVGEVGAVARASGVAGLGDDDDLLRAVLDVARDSAGNVSSMHADVRSGRTPEVDFINGFVVARAAELGLDATANAVLADLVSAAASPLGPTLAPPLAPPLGPPLGEMELLREVANVREFRSSLPPGLSVGFVPTMGALHDGHLDLVRQAKRENDVVVVSIFVNPEQFAPGEDLEAYPRTLQADLRLLRDLGGVHAVFCPPTADALYPNGGQARAHVELVDSDASPEGQARPGFFKGVATVVSKLFNIVQPTRAYFGQKDGQQCVVVKRMVEELNFPVEVVVVPTAREASGLARSSRNAYLTAAEVEVAGLVYTALRAAASAAASTASSSAGADLEAAARAALEPAGALLELQYVRVSPGHEEGQRMVSIAVRAVESGTRLIDNVCV